MPETPPQSAAAPAPGREFLARILERRRARVEAAAARTSQAELERAAAGQIRRDFAGGLRAAARRGGLAILAELKQASPSRGRLRADFDPAGIARGYAAAGAAALSVLTEEDFFLGSLQDLQAARQASGLPVLRKDFIFSSYQVWESAAAGADALLLIAALLTDAELAQLQAEAARAELAVLVEVHDAAEAARAGRLGAAIIGVNNRDLHSFAVDSNRCLELAPRLPAAALRVAESGIAAPAMLGRLQTAGYTAALIGEHFMRAPDPGRALRELLGAANLSGAAATTP